jgi:hypothetical protein
MESVNRLCLAAIVALMQAAAWAAQAATAGGVVFHGNSDSAFHLMVKSAP